MIAGTIFPPEFLNGFMIHTATTSQYQQADYETKGNSIHQFKWVNLFGNKEFVIRNS